MEDNEKYMNDDLISAIKASRMLEPWKIEFKINNLYISIMVHHEDSDYVGIFDIGNN